MRVRNYDTRAKLCDKNVCDIIDKNRICMEPEFSICTHSKQIRRNAQSPEPRTFGIQLLIGRRFWRASIPRRRVGRRAVTRRIHRFPESRGGAATGLCAHGRRLFPILFVFRRPHGDTNTHIHII